MIVRQDFAQVLNQEFDLFVGATTMTVTLVGLEPFATRDTEVREGFSLIFKSASRIVLPQQTYPMRNRHFQDATTVDVFIVPIGRDPDGVRYQAIFN